MRKGEENSGGKIITILTGLLLGGMIALISCMVLLALSAFLISSGAVGDGMMYYLTVGSCVIGCFIGGQVAVRRVGSHRLPVGAGSGCVFALLILAVGVLCLEEMSPQLSSLGFLAGGVLGGAAAGLLGGKRKKKRRK